MTIRIVGIWAAADSFAVGLNLRFCGFGIGYALKPRAEPFWGFGLVRSRGFRPKALTTHDRDTNPKPMSPIVSYT